AVDRAAFRWAEGHLRLLAAVGARRVEEFTRSTEAAAATAATASGRSSSRFEPHNSCSRAPTRRTLRPKEPDRNLGTRRFQERSLEYARQAGAAGVARMADHEDALVYMEGRYVPWSDS